VNNAPSGKLKLNLKIQIDEPDWIQVSDNEGEGEAEGDVDDDCFGRDKALGKYQSYIFTKSGTIFVDGFSAGIGTSGIASVNTNGKHSRTLHKLPMKERLCMLCKLGQGASGIVYKALDLSEMRLVAVKMISVFDRAKRRQMVRELSALFQMLRSRHSEMLRDGSEVGSLGRLFSNTSEAFDSSADAANSCISTSNNATGEPETTRDGIVNEGTGFGVAQNIVDLYDAFSNLEDGGVALMMEYMDGGSLQDIVDSGGCSDEATLANIAIQGLQGLNFLHRCNQIHRDIKPGNLLINQYGAVKVSDLGILRQLDTEADCEGDVRVGQVGSPSIMRANTFVGTATFMAPVKLITRSFIS
jgi:hypothetical protein